MSEKDEMWVIIQTKKKEQNASEQMDFTGTENSLKFMFMRTINWTK